MERRQFVKAAALVSTGFAVTPAFAAAPAAGSSSEGAKKPSALLVSSPEAIKILSHFAQMAAACALSGDICVQHCEERLVSGGAEFAECLVSSSQMAVVCDAVAKLAAMKSIRLGEVLDSCSAACKACQTSCEEHKAHWAHGMHLECKACAEHCATMIAEITKLKAAFAKV